MTPLYILYNGVLFKPSMVLCKGRKRSSRYIIQVNDDQTVQNLSKMPLIDNINNTIYYTTLAQHTSIHTFTFYLITVVNSDANVKLRPEGGATMTLNPPQFCPTYTTVDLV
jgi:hypothetical protein